jgi:hypothetical protein
MKSHDFDYFVGKYNIYLLVNLDILILKKVYLK